MACPDKTNDEIIINEIARRNAIKQQEQILEWSGNLMDFYQFGKDEDITGIWKTATGYAVSLKQ